MVNQTNNEEVKMKRRIKIKLCKVLLSVLMLISIFSSTLWAGTTGKIAGVVIDKATGEPLAGANIIIEGTSMGSSTDEDGSYFIINIPPGTYSVTAIYMGYVKMTKSNVQVIVDRTTRVDFYLKPTIMTGEKVVVVATKPIIEKDVTGSGINLDQTFINNAPVIKLTDALRQQSGIYYTGETTYLRGGLSTEINYNLDGTSLNSGLLSDNWQRLNVTAIQEVSVLTGGYNAEYGQALSGVVNVVTKEPSVLDRNFHGTVVYRIRPAGQYHWGRNMYDKSLWKYTNYDLDYWKEKLEDPVQAQGFAQYFKRFYGWDGNTIPTAEQLLETYRKQITPDPVLGDYTKRPQHEIEATVYGSPMNKVSLLLSARYKRGVNIYPQAEKYNPEYNLQGKLTYYLDDTKKLSLELLRGWYKSCTYTESNWNNFESSQEAQWQPNSDVRNPYDGQAYAPWGGYWLKGPEEKSLNVATLKWQHTLNPATYYTLQLTYLYDNMTELQDYSKLKTDLSTVGWGDSWFDLGGNFRLESRQIQVNNYSKSKVFTAKGDLLSQVTNAHQVKTGAEFKFYDVDYQHYYMEFPAGDVWHLDNVFNGKPVEGAFYIQDKMEYQGIILNIGVRISGFNARHDYPESIYDPVAFETWHGGDGTHPSNTAPIWQSYMPAKDWFATYKDYRSFFDGHRQDKNTVKSDWKFAVAPRLGLSFPMTENSKLRFSYGHFYQRPSWAKVLGFPTSWYDSDPYGSVRMDQWQGWYGHPGLTYSRTIQYELGFDQNLFNIFRLTLTGYYKDSDRLNGFSHQSTYNQSGGGFALTGWGNNIYTTSIARNIANDGHDNIFYTNNAFRDVRGIEITIDKLFNKRWSANLTFNYGLSTGGATGYWQYREDASQPNQPQSFSETKANWISSYIFKGNAIYITPQKWGYASDISMGVYYEYFAGPEYTYYPDDYTGLRVPNNKRWYPHQRTDLKLTKKIPIKNVTAKIGVEIFNLFNNYDRVLLGGDDLKKWEENKEKPKVWQSGEDNVWWFYNSVSNPKRMAYLTFTLEF